MRPMIDHLTNRLQTFRSSLANIDALPQLSILALIIGAGTGMMIVMFRLVIEFPFNFMEVGHGEDFESLSISYRITLVMVGSILIASILQRLDKYQRQMGVAHVIDRLHNHQGHLPSRNWLAQFALAAIAIITGHTPGREGPVVHLGAGTASKIGRWMRLPSNSMQTLIACGVAAAISALFDTPLAGVIFAMEVIVMEYTIVGFVPVILSSVIGATVCKTLLGSTIVFAVGNSNMNSLAELPFIILCGLVTAFLAGSYIRINVWSTRFNHHPVFLRVMIAGILTAIACTIAPEIMGLGYDTIQNALNGNLLLGTLILITIVKLVLTPLVVGLGIPGGLIGPALFIGACCGAITGFLLSYFFPNLQVNTELYVLLGMTGMMAAVINAPLAALVAVLELSRNPDIIFPAMLMIVVACVTTRLVFGVKSIFMEQLANAGKDIELGPATRSLRTSSVLRILDKQFIFSNPVTEVEKIRHILNKQPQWIVFYEKEQLQAIPASDLAMFLSQAPKNISEEKADVILKEVPGRRYLLDPILDSASLYEALVLLKKKQREMLYVTSDLRSRRSIHGIITLDAVQNYYQPKHVLRQVT